MTVLKSHGHSVTYTCNDCNTFRRIPAPPVETSPNSSPIAQQSETITPAASCNTEPGQSDIAATSENDAEAGGSGAATKTPRAAKPRWRRGRQPKPRPLPFFAREGHAVFVGNERMDHEDAAMNID